MGIIDYEAIISKEEFIAAQRTLLKKMSDSGEYGKFYHKGYYDNVSYPDAGRAIHMAYDHIIEKYEQKKWLPIEDAPNDVPIVLKYRDSVECVYPRVIFIDEDDGHTRLVSYPKEQHGDCDEMENFSHFMLLPQLPKEN
jgi:hypothetical protein